MRLKSQYQTPVRKRRSRRLNGGDNLTRMMTIIIYQQDPSVCQKQVAIQLKSATDSTKLGQGRQHRLIGYTKLMGNGNSSQGIQNVVPTRQIQIDMQFKPNIALDAEVRPSPLVANIRGP